MTLFNVVLAYNVPVYGTAEIEAASFEDAVEKVRQAVLSGLSDEQPIWDIYDVDHGSPSEHRISSIEDEDGGATVHDIDLTYPDQPWSIMSAEEVAEVLADAEIIEEITA
jgi:hypothetical protein